MAKNRPLVTLKPLGVNTVRTKCQKKNRKLVKLCVYVCTNFQAQALLLFRIYNLHHSSRIFFERKKHNFFRQFEHMYVKVHTVSTHIIDNEYVDGVVTFRIFELRFKKWLELLCFLIFYMCKADDFQQFFLYQGIFVLPNILILCSNFFLFETLRIVSSQNYKKK